MTAAIALLFIALPWLNPFSPGPMVQPGSVLFAWTCAAALLLALAFDKRRGESRTMTRAVVLGWALAGVVSAVYGLLQYFGHSDALGVWINYLQSGQAYGNLKQRNQFATLMNIGLVALLWLVIDWSAACEKRRKYGWLGLAAAGLAAVLLMAGNAASASRTGLLQLVLILLLGLWWQRKVARQQLRYVQVLLLSALLAYALASFALPWLAGFDISGSAWERLRAGDGASCQSRLILWSNVIHLISLKPWLGWGWGELDFAHFITLYPQQRFCDILDNAHNLPLHLAVELGLPVAVLACTLLLWLLWRGKPWCERSPTRQLAWGVLAVIGLHSLLEYPLWYGPFQVAVALCLWFLYWAPRDAGLDAERAPSGAKVATSYKLAAIALALVCNVAWWNYNVVSQLFVAPQMRRPAYRENTLEKVQQATWMYQDMLRFAELVISNLTPANAEHLNALAKQSLHFSPEPRVVEKLIDSALLMGRKDEVAFYAARYQAAFPQAYAKWQAKHQGTAPAQ